MDPFTKKNISSGIILYKERQFIKSSFHMLLKYFQSSEEEYAKVDISASSTAFTTAQKLRQNSFTCFALKEFSTTKSHLIPEQLNKIEGVLREIYREYALSAEEIRKRKTFVEDLEKYIQERVPGAELVMIGSGVNGFGLKDSDVDISMCVADETEDEQALLKETKYHLMRNKKYDNILLLGKAVTPIIKFLYKPLNYQVDICINNFPTVHNSHLLRTYCKYDERCKLLGCALKVLAKKNDICSAAKQTLSSYSYILMVINYLQQVKPPVLPRFEIQDENVFQDNLKVPFRTLVKNKWMYEDRQTLRKLHSLKDNSTSLPELWLGLLKYYSSKKENVISIRKERMEVTDLPKNAALYNIDDPFIKKNLGCSLSGHNVSKVLSVLNRAIYLLENEVPDSIKDLKDYYFCLK
ncbi:terminal uridylyltransferase 4-like [Stegodyphus dumicola]|uniref:terminal uridylyltransferase 4-like n=1 Tax=Stegodyphus dumicola TaxID=202533 RepID=UPI0015B1BF7D|nr:terminal uridylyltransferase 4-like [Stegodyphus dumicola]